MINNFIKKVENILKLAEIEEYKQEAKLIIKEISNLSLEEIILKNNIPNQEKILEIATLRAKTKKPIQHLIGYSYFMNEKYIVNENVLIPRDETELLVLNSFNLVKNQKEKLDILEIGIGSGCVSCALAKKLLQNNINDFEILGVDISLEALETTIENINNLNLVRKVIIRKSDLFSKIRLNIEKFDLIISNPPYIPIKEKENLQQEVKFEPKLALFSEDEDGINFYQKIIEQSKPFLKENGKIAFELGINQSELVKNIFLQNGFKNIEIIKDLAKIDRVIFANI